MSLEAIIAVILFIFRVLKVTAPSGIESNPFLPHLIAKKDPYYTALIF
jgi:hypothetical protein